MVNVLSKLAINHLVYIYNMTWKTWKSNTNTSRDENASLKHIKAILDVSTLEWKEDARTQENTNWSSIKRTTVAGKRVAFCEGRGKISDLESGWKYTYQRNNMEIFFACASYPCTPTTPRVSCEGSVANSQVREPETYLWCSAAHNP